MLASRHTVHGLALLLCTNHIVVEYEVALRSLSKELEQAVIE